MEVLCSTAAASGAVNKPQCDMSHLFNWHLIMEPTPLKAKMPAASSGLQSTIDSTDKRRCDWFLAGCRRKV
jgi:hypothetical protein